jgi:hypothetical protein
MKQPIVLTAETRSCDISAEPKLVIDSLAKSDSVVAGSPRRSLSNKIQQVPSNQSELIQPLITASPPSSKKYDQGERRRVCRGTTFISCGLTMLLGTRKVWIWRDSVRPIDMHVGWCIKCVSASLTQMTIGGSKSVMAQAENRL